MERKLQILMLEDVEADAGLIVWTLEKAGLQFDHKRVDNREDFTKALRDFKPDVILSDHSMPQFNSLEALDIYRGSDVRVPFILVTGTVSEEFAVTSLKKGADDYLLKTNLTRLPAAIQNALLQRDLKQKQRVTELELRLQNDELVKINQELDNFVYSVSHNLRAPLSTVIGLLNLAKLENRGTPAWPEFVSMMDASLLKLDQTVREILDYSKNARCEVTCEEIDFQKISQELFNSLKYMEGFEDIKKDVAIIGSEPFFSDSYRIKVIMNNLLTNAIRYRDESKPNCYVGIRVDVHDQLAQIVIEDNGIGIPPEMKGKVFNMFFRGSVKSDGAGLGLYIVREMVSKLNGKIFLESDYGTGTKVRIELPGMVPKNVPYENVA